MQGILPFPHRPRRPSGCIPIPPPVFASMQSRSSPRVISSPNPSTPPNKAGRVPPLKEVHSHSLKSDDDPISDEIIPMHYAHVPQLRPKIAIQQFASLPQISSQRYASILEQKLEFCCQICDFYHAEADAEGKAFKQTVLEEIFSSLATRGGFYHVTSTDSVIKMIKANIIRALPVIDSIYFIHDGIPPISEPAWPHLSIIYNLLNRMIDEIPDDPCFNNELAFQLTPMLRSPDEAERHQLVKFTIAYLTTHREQSEAVLDKLSHVLSADAENGDATFIVSPILEIMLHIFQSSPILLQMNAAKFTRQIVGLLREKYLPIFYTQLLPLITFFTEEYNAIVTIVIRTILKNWPYTRNCKQALFLHLLTTLLPQMPAKDRTVYFPRIILMYADCSISMSHRVAEAAFEIWTSFHVEPILQENSRKIIPIMYPVVMRALREHWNQGVRESASMALKLMNRIDPRTMQEISQNKEANEEAEESDRVRNWASIARTACHSCREFHLGSKLAEITALYNRQQKTEEMLCPMQKNRRSRSNSFRQPIIVKPSLTSASPISVN